MNISEHLMNLRPITFCPIHVSALEKELLKQAISDSMQRLIPVDRLKQDHILWETHLWSCYSFVVLYGEVWLCGGKIPDEARQKLQFPVVWAAMQYLVHCVALNVTEETEWACQPLDNRWGQAWRLEYLLRRRMDVWFAMETIRQFLEQDRSSYESPLDYDASELKALWDEIQVCVQAWDAKLQSPEGLRYFCWIASLPAWLEYREKISTQRTSQLPWWLSNLMLSVYQLVYGGES